ncbi:hypothetical protein GYMLUDRAFT_384403 [Collybiopsis luxurians FD-317 M1]|nr:hypothetical protein GYMLUDRAFT_384403 [Collybiopsis luxurians FD-317 M1]
MSEMKIDNALKDRLVSWTAVPALELLTTSDTGSISTRNPSLYDTHLPPSLQPTTTSFGSFRRLDKDGKSAETVPAEDRLMERICSRPSSLTLLHGKQGEVLGNKWALLLRKLGSSQVFDEEGVVDAQKRVVEVALELATLALFDLSQIQVENLGRWQLLTHYTSQEKETKADLLIGLPKQKLVHASEQRLILEVIGFQPVSPLVRHLHRLYMECIESVGCKKLTVGDVLTFLTLLLLIRLMATNKIPSIWPSPACGGCEKYARSHRALSAAAPEPVVLPEDSKIDFGLTSADIKHLDEEIGRLLREFFKPNLDNDVKEPTITRYQNKWTRSVFPQMQNLWTQELSVAVGFDVTKYVSLKEVMQRVRPARNIFIQVSVRLMISCTIY